MMNYKLENYLAIIDSYDKDVTKFKKLYKNLHGCFNAFLTDKYHLQWEGYSTDGNLYGPNYDPYDDEDEDYDNEDIPSDNSYVDIDNFATIFSENQYNTKFTEKELRTKTDYDEYDYETCANQLMELIIKIVKNRPYLYYFFANLDLENDNVTTILTKGDGFVENTNLIRQYLELEKEIPNEDLTLAKELDFSKEFNIEE